MTDRQKWWRLFLRHEPKLKDIALRFHACDGREWEGMVFNHELDKLGAVLQRAWDHAPDQRWIHEIPGWGVLCDLCADYCFGEISNKT